MGPCMCGDICCSSCGPAQGNWRCPLCRQWASEGCEHMDAEGRDLKPEFLAEAAAKAKAEYEAELAWMIEEQRYLAEEEELRRK